MKFFIPKKKQMGIRVTYYENPHASIRELLETSYAPFREWVIDMGGWDYRNFPAMDDAQNHVLELLLENEQLLPFEKMEEELVDQFVFSILTESWKKDGKYRELVNYIDSSHLKLDHYEAALEVIRETGNKTAERLWQYIIYGRSVADPGQFFGPYVFSSFRFGYWTVAECGQMFAVLKNLPTTPESFNALHTVLEIVRDKIDRKTPGELIIYVS